RISGRDFRDLGQHLTKCRRGANDFLEHRRMIDFLAQREVLFARSLLGLLAILDVGTRRVPTNDVSRFVSQRVVMNQEPAILTIPATDSSFVREWDSSRDRRIAFVA